MANQDRTILYFHIISLETKPNSEQHNNIEHYNLNINHNAY